MGVYPIKGEIKFQFLEGQVPTVQALLERFVPDKLLTSIAKHSNAYARSKGHKLAPITETDLALFFALIFYMDVVSLPAKKDYWRGEGMWPTHKPFSYMSERRFHQIWMNPIPDKQGEDWAHNYFKIIQEHLLDFKTKISNHPFGTIPILRHPTLLQKLKRKVTINPTLDMPKPTGI